MKEHSINRKFKTGFEDELNKLSNGLLKKS